MKLLKEYYEKAATELNVDLEAPVPKISFRFHAHCNGYIKICETEREAVAFSNHMDRIKSQESVNALLIYRSKISAVHGLAVEYWNIDIRQKFADISDEMFNECLEKTEEMFYSYGYDVIANNMVMVCSMAQAAREVSKLELFK
jgi:hypothetical protein